FRLVNGIAGVLATSNFGEGPPPKAGDVPPKFPYRADDLLLLKNEAIACMPLGGFLVEGNDVVFEGNTVKGAGGFGIWYRSWGPESRTYITKNTVQHTKFELLFHGPGDCPIPSGNGIDAAGGRVDIVSNRSEYNEMGGIKLQIWSEGLFEGKTEGNKYHSRVVSNIAFNNGAEKWFSFEPDDPSPFDANEDGIWVYDEYGLGVLISKNVAHYNGDDGIKLIGRTFTVLGNKASWNNDDGIDAEVDDSRIDKNTVTHNTDDGLTGEQFEGPGDNPGVGNLISNNKADYNADEGIDIRGSHHYIYKNKAIGNLQNGICVRDGDYVVIEANQADKNGHQGITNGVWMADILFNKAKDNACGLGPDIAGEGGGSGFVDQWTGNQYGTGGRYATDRCEEP
ncbi:MAG: right-handed parallel beta-helix repeat-containing protein, partial [Planctomycetota bacterium]